MDDSTNPDANQGARPADAGVTRRMDAPPADRTGQPEHETEPYRALQSGAPAPPQQGYAYDQPQAYDAATAPAPYPTPQDYSQPAPYPTPQDYSQPAPYATPQDHSQPAPYAAPPYSAPQYAAPPQYSPPQYTMPQQYSPPPQYPAAQPYAGPQQQYAVPGSYNPGPGGYTANAAIRDPNIGLVVELLGGFFGFLGLGHMLSGYVMRGVILLVSWWVGLGLSIFLFSFLGAFTCGIGALPLCLLPLVPVASALWLRGDMARQPR